SLQFLLHSVSDQLCSQSSCSAGQIIGGDGIRMLCGIQRPLQSLLHHQQRLCVGLQQLDVPLQLRLPGVDLLESLSKKTRSCGLGLQSCSLGVLAQGSGLLLDVLGVSAVGTGLYKDGLVIGEPFSRSRGRLRHFLLQRRTFLEGCNAPGCWGSLYL
uniref:Uncharacterized protein n=1 Tax=Poecilia reticulata TaxID=8081 RepID=A0A3P9MT12_POERE